MKTDKQLQEGVLEVLKGTVHSLSERDAAEHAVWAAPGVVAIDDQLVVAP